MLLLAGEMTDGRPRQPHSGAEQRQRKDKGNLTLHKPNATVWQLNMTSGQVWSPLQVKAFPGSQIYVTGNLWVIPFSCRDQQGGEFILLLQLTVLLLAEGSVASPAAGGVHELLMVFSESQRPHPAIKRPLWSSQCTST